jgi:hypothetical protein
MPAPDETLFSRGGRLLDLALERHLAGALEPASAARVEAHLAAHAEDAARLAAARADRAAARAAPTPDFLRAPPAQVIPLRPRRRFAPAWAGLAMAAAALFAVRGLPEVAPTGAPVGGDTVRLRGAGLELGVFTEDGHRLGAGDVAPAGARLGFQVRSVEAGQLLIVGVDEADTVYPCYPADGASTAVAVTQGLESVGAAIRLDAKPGVERLVALRCAAPLTLDAIAADLVAARGAATPGALLPALVPGCAQDEVAVTKGGRP